MTPEALGYIADKLMDSGISYAFQDWTAESVPDPYWIGDYNEIASINEDNKSQSTFVLTGTTAGSWLVIEEEKEKVKSLFPDFGETLLLPSGSGIAISYEEAFHIPSDDAEIKRIQINLNVKEWRC